MSLLALVGRGNRGNSGQLWLPAAPLPAAASRRAASSVMTPPVATNPQFTAQQAHALLAQAWPSFADDATVLEIPVCVAWPQVHRDPPRSFLQCTCVLVALWVPLYSHMTMQTGRSCSMVLPLLC